LAMSSPKPNGNGGGNQPGKRSKQAARFPSLQKRASQSKSAEKAYHTRMSCSRVSTKRDSRSSNSPQSSKSSNRTSNSVNLKNSFNPSLLPSKTQRRATRNC